MKKVTSIALWVLSVFFIFSCLIYIPALCSVFMLLVGGALLPVKKWQNVINKFFPKRGLKTSVIVVLVILAFVTVPVSSNIENNLSSNISHNRGITDSSIPTDSEVSNNTNTSEIIENESIDDTDIPLIVAPETKTTEQAQPLETILEDPEPEKALSSDDTDISSNVAPKTKTTEQAQPLETILEDPEPEKDISPNELPKDSSFKVHYIDVGQGDSALVLCDGKAMLIDGGNVADSSLIYSYLKKLNINHLDYIVCSHAHEDHIGGLSGALNYAKVDKVFAPVTSYDSKAFSNFVKYLDNQGRSITVPSPGDEFSLGSASVSVLGTKKVAKNANNTSIVLRIVYGKTSFIFTGDAKRENEQDILNAGFTLSSTVLKVAHHGSETSTSYPFLREIMPEYAIISVGADNSYGHPTEATLSRLRDADVKVYRTDMQGDIICTSNGKDVSFVVERNADADTLSSVSKNIIQDDNKTAVPEETITPSKGTSTGIDYVLNTNTKKFHYPYCSSVDAMKEKNKKFYTGNRKDVINWGYSPCRRCEP